MKAGWEVKPLGEVCEIYQPKTISKKEMIDEGAYPVFGANGVIGRYDQFNHEEPQLLITCRGATCGSVNVSEPFSWITGNSMVVRPKIADLDQDFLKYFFFGAIDLNGVITGAAQPQITRTTLSPVSLPIPPLEEQKQIVAVLDAAFEGLTRAKENAEANLQNARELFEAQLKAQFEPIPKGWIRTRLDEICTKIGSGATPRGGKNAYKDEGTSLVRSLNVHDREFRHKDLAFIDDEQAEKLSIVKVEADDLLLNITGASVARCAQVDNSVLPARVNQHVAIIRPKAQSVSTKFLCFELTSEPFKKALLKTGEEGGATRQAITKAQIQALEVCYPEKDGDQQDICNVLNEAEEKSIELAIYYTTKLTDIADLRQSLLQKAFAGELT